MSAQTGRPVEQNSSVVGISERVLNERRAKTPVRPLYSALVTEAVGISGKRLSALAHPIRLHILSVAESEDISASEVAVALSEPLGVVAYHFRVLHNAGLIELTATEQRRGWVQSFYRATGPGWSDLASTLRGMVGETDSME